MNADYPVVLGTSVKDARKISTDEDLKEYIKNTPGAKEILITKNYKRPYFQYTVQTAREPTNEDLNFNTRMRQVTDLVKKTCGEQDRIRYTAMTHKSQTMDFYTTKIRIVVLGCCVDDFTKLKKIAPEGFDTDIYRVNQQIEYKDWSHKEGVPIQDHFVHAGEADCLCFEQPTIIKKQFEIQPSDFEEFEKTNFKLNDPPCYVRINKYGELQFLKKNDLYLLYENMADLGKTSFIKAWCQYSGIRTYERTDLLPRPLEAPSDVYNTWSGFICEKFPQNGTIDVMTTHIKNLFGNERHYNYFITWLATIFQTPAYRTEVCLVLISEEGTGKGIIFDHLVQRMIGHYYGRTAQPKDDLFNTFSQLRKNKIFINIDDANIGEMKINSDTFLSYVTGEFIKYEGKGQNAVTCRNNMNFCVTSNKDTPVKISASDRRFCVLECNNELRFKPRSYFNTIGEWLKSDANIGAFYKFLMDWDIQINLKDDRPITEAYNEIRGASVDKELLFLASMLENNHIFKLEELYNSFKHWLIDSGFTEYKVRDIISFGRYWAKIAKSNDFVVRDIIGGGKSKYSFDKKKTAEWLRAKNIEVAGVCLI
jgi:hypothetical protein